MANSRELTCPKCGKLLQYVADIGAPGIGQVWDCGGSHARGCGKRFVVVGTTIYDPSDNCEGEPPWVLSPDDCV